MQNGIVIKSKYYVFYFTKNNLKCKRLAVIVKKKIGIAVLRNREKRIVKEIFRHIKTDIDIDLVVFVKKNDASFSEKEEVFNRNVTEIEKYVNV